MIKSVKPNDKFYFVSVDSRPPKIPFPLMEFSESNYRRENGLEPLDANVENQLMEDHNTENQVVEESIKLQKEDTITSILVVPSDTMDTIHEDELNISNTENNAETKSIVSDTPQDLTSDLIQPPTIDTFEQTVQPQMIPLTA